MKAVMRQVLIAVVGGFLLACLIGALLDGHARRSEPPDTFHPRQHESVPLFTSCEHARQAGVPLPLVHGDPGWNPRLDRDRDGRAC